MLSAKQQLFCFNELWPTDQQTERQAHYTHNFIDENIMMFWGNFQLFIINSQPS